MDRGRLRWGLRGAAVLVGAAALLLWTMQRPNVKVENRAGQVITVLNLTVADQTSIFRNVAKDADVVAPFAAKVGDAFSVQGELADGAVIRASGTVQAENFGLTISPRGGVTVRQAGKG